MAPHPHRSNSRPTPDQQQLTLAGVLGYLAVLAGVLAVLSAPILTGSVLVLGALSYTVVRSMARKQRSEARTTDDSTTVTASTVVE